jgi:DNA invertase Pin-like site-specific DNA recombinase
MKWAYCRVSTFEQDPKVQIEWAKAKGVDETHILAEKRSGKSKENRVKLNELMNKVEQGDEVYIYKLDRLSRNTQDSLNIMEEMRRKQVTMIFGDLGKIENDEISNLVFTVFSAIAEMERNRIVERTQAGKKYQREHNPNFKEGRPSKLTEYQVQQLVKRKQTESVTELARGYNISRKTVYRYLALYRDEDLKTS